MDVSGEMHLDVDHDVWKVRLDSRGTAIKGSDKAVVGPTTPPQNLPGAHGGNATCMSCYGAETNPGDCCNTCEEVRSIC